MIIIHKNRIIYVSKDQKFISFIDYEDEKDQFSFSDAQVSLAPTPVSPSVGS